MSLSNFNLNHHFVFSFVYWFVHAILSPLSCCSASVLALRLSKPRTRWAEWADTHTHTHTHTPGLPVLLVRCRPSLMDSQLELASERASEYDWLAGKASGRLRQQSNTDPDQCFSVLVSSYGSPSISTSSLANRFNKAIQVCPTIYKKRQWFISIWEDRLT